MAEKFVKLDVWVSEMAKEALTADEIRQAFTHATNEVEKLGKEWHKGVCWDVGFKLRGRGWRVALDHQGDMIKGFLGLPQEITFHGD